MEKKLEVVTPMVPNFVRVGPTMLCISEFTDKEIEQLGKMWVEDLLKRKYAIIVSRLYSKAKRTKV